MTWLLETPERRLERLLAHGAWRQTDTGYAVWCPLCKTNVPVFEEFVPHHGWFEFCSDMYLDHVNEVHDDSE